MINLIPNTQKKAMVRNLYFRLAILCLVVGGIVFLILSIAILPAFVLSFTRNNISETRLQLQESEPVTLPDQETLAAVEDLDAKLVVIESAQIGKFVVSEKVINSILLKKMPGIKITEISYVHDPAKKLTDGQTDRGISLKGTASSRETLLMFRQALEDSNNFKQVDLPISNFVRGSDLQFYFQLISR